MVLAWTRRAEMALGGAKPGDSEQTDHRPRCMTIVFAPPGDKTALEEGSAFTPNFDASGLITCVTTEGTTGAVLMVAYMNAEGLSKTLEPGVWALWWGLGGGVVGCGVVA